MRIYVCLCVLWVFFPLCVCVCVRARKQETEISMQAHAAVAAQICLTSRPVIVFDTLWSELSKGCATAEAHLAVAQVCAWYLCVDQSPLPAVWLVSVLISVGNIFNMTAVRFGAAVLSFV